MLRLFVLLDVTFNFGCLSVTLQNDAGVDEVEDILCPAVHEIKKKEGWTRPNVGQSATVTFIFQNLHSRSYFSEQLDPLM